MTCLLVSAAVQLVDGYIFGEVFLTRYAELLCLPRRFAKWLRQVHRGQVVVEPSVSFRRKPKERKYVFTPPLGRWARSLRVARLCLDEWEKCSAFGRVS
jgi:hypothetical protein